MPKVSKASEKSEKGQGMEVPKVTKGSLDTLDTDLHGRVSQKKRMVTMDGKRVEAEVCSTFCYDENHFEGA